MLEATHDDAWDAIVMIERESGKRAYGHALRLGVDPAGAADLVQGSAAPLESRLVLD